MYPQFSNPTPKNVSERTKTIRICTKMPVAGLLRTGWGRKPSECSFKKWLSNHGMFIPIITCNN